MESVRSNRSHRPGSSLNKVGPSQLMWAEAKLQSQIIWAQNGDEGPTPDNLRSLQLLSRLRHSLFANRSATSEGQLWIRSSRSALSATRIRKACRYRAIQPDRSVRRERKTPAHSLQPCGNRSSTPHRYSEKCPLHSGARADG